MGAPIQYLSVQKVNPFVIFPNRFVIECDETVHIHYRNMRMEMSEENFDKIAEAFVKAKEKKDKEGIHCNPRQHLELSRAMIYDHIKEDEWEVTKDLNQYKLLKYDNAEFYDDNVFIHIHWKGIRTELSKDEFREYVDNLVEARDNLDKKWKKDLEQS